MSAEQQTATLDQPAELTDAERLIQAAQKRYLTGAPVTPEDTYALMVAIHKEVSFLADLARIMQAGLPEVAAQIQEKVPDFLGGRAKSGLLGLIGKMGGQ